MVDHGAFDARLVHQCRCRVAERMEVQPGTVQTDIAPVPSEPLRESMPKASVGSSRLKPRKEPFFTMLTAPLHIFEKTETDQFPVDGHEARCTLILERPRRAVIQIEVPDALGLPHVLNVKLANLLLTHAREHRDDRKPENLSSLMISKPASLLRVSDFAAAPDRAREQLSELLRGPHRALLGGPVLQQQSETQRRCFARPFRPGARKPKERTTPRNGVTVFCVMRGVRVDGVTAS